MKKNHFLEKVGVVGIIVIFICASFVSNIGGYSEDINQVDTNVSDVFVSHENVLVICRTFGFPGEPLQEVTMSLDEAEFLLDKIKELQIENARDPLSEKIQKLQHEIITLADKHNLLPASLTSDTLKSRLIHSSRPQYPGVTLPRLQNRASEMFCNYVSIGSGSSFPIIILPRLIPILLTPIPRLFVRWSTLDGATSCGGLRSGTGFIAIGPQKGIALGFWGIGFSIFLPPVMAYGLLGYALFATVNAQEIEFWPPNYPPEITAVSPLDGAVNVPVSTSELRFHISDPNGDLMSYSVTTTPYVGSGSGNNKPDGTYSVPISGLEGSEEYTWFVQVSDGEEVVDVSFTFSTELVAPIVSDPYPEDGARYVPVDLSKLSFYLRDPQGDLMDYTVETYPDIGSGNGSGVGDGTYTADVSGLDNLTDYIWYVNVTDGVNWKHKVYGFQTEPQMVFDPFAEGWQYRKQITIDHTKVDGDLTNFPVLVSVIDSDLRDKAQDDGNDILFMDGTGVANRLYHEIEKFDGLSGELDAWVNVTNVASDQDTTLNIYYGNPSCNNQQFPDKTWDNNYWMVQHLNEEGTGTRYDSTSNNNDGFPRNYDGDEATDSGKINGGDYLDGGNDYMTFEGYPITPTYTVSYWVKLADISGTQFLLDVYSDYFMGNGHEMIFTILYERVSGDYFFTMSEHAGGGIQTGQLVDYEWHYFIGVKTSSNSLDVYVDGSYEHTHTGTFDTPEFMVIGCDDYHNTYYSNGIYDEVRTSKIARSSAWISTEYNNQNDPSIFLSFGPEETGP